MSSIAHMLAHSADHDTVSAGSNELSTNSQLGPSSTTTTSTEAPNLIPSTTSQGSDPNSTIRLSNSNSNNNNNNNNMTPRDHTALEDGALKNGNELRSAGSSSANSTSSTQPITPAIRTSVDLSADANAENFDSLESQAKQQRKRSKVSRACDECRRKKIRCDATFSTTSNSVVKPCTSCIKNKENCSFQRVPLKRGPTKGYTKEGAEGRERSRSTTSRRSSSMGNQSLPSHQQQQQLQPNSSSPITLPPLVSLTNNVAFRNYSTSASSTGGTSPIPGSRDVNDVSQPASPRRGSAFGNQVSPNSAPVSVPPSSVGAASQANSNGPVPQGLFWKVPYSQGPFDRRGSVDSVSSSLSERSPRFPSTSSSTGSNFIFGQRPVSYENSVVSDSDDDRGSNYSPRASIDVTRSNRSRSNSTNMQVPTSPALSVSSLNSLNQGFNKNLNIQSNSNPNFMMAQQQQNQMVEIYYQLIHPSFPILPLNKQSLGNLLAIPAPSGSENNNELHEINNLIVHSFYASLDILITAVSRGSRSPSVISLPNGPLGSNTSPVDVINQIFTNLLRVFPIFQSKFNLYSQNIVILLSSTFVILSYAITLSGFESDVYISSSVSVFNRLKIFRLFWDPVHSVTRENYDDYNSILKRLYINIHIIDTLQSLSFGLPKVLNSDYDPSIIDQLFPNFGNFNGVSGIDFEVTKNNLKFGLILSKISSSRSFTNPNLSTLLSHDLKNKYNYFNNILNKDAKQDQVVLNFLDLIVAKFELIGFLDEVYQSFNNNTATIDEELVYDFQLKALRIVKKNLELQSNLLKSIKNYSNSIETNSLISPFLPLVFKQSIKALNIQKIVINSLQINKDLLTRLSKPLNDLISLNNYLSLLKPFNNEEMNNHMKFTFVSEHLKHLEYIDNTSNTKAKEIENLKHWIGLMKDVKQFIQRDDYEGWF